ncbi:MAG: DUF2314 domain-containing protein [Deltaproteobacteria bacterium]|nr:DUF2314 domain-containing protein [Deltaproteobacteria bacterium]
MKSRSILVTVFIATFLILFGCNQKSELLTNQYDEKEMNQAIETAQLTFDKFLERFRNPQPGDEDFNVKVKIEDKNGVEHFWLSDLRLGSEPYIGIIGNDPGIVRNVKFGQQYSFQRADIRDWMFMSNGKMQGNYTLRVILKSMPEEESEEIKKNIGW